ncbi:hypothetical protein D0Z07_3517 [Hyphodiscus hymeniophilus]|uniref:Altered inheritance of mitochondria protein 21 n=1 Tax=Hyphodiscus hymeniophilus TaxID=353542 RepID=A0A9P7AXM0_9HELO|nr:hypothetical protein D0Z07_3517 [Hyphodiscus hymeniophilus]
MSTAMPQVPPRPSRAHQQSSAVDSGRSLGSDMPKIPPRPANRRIDRSMSPSRESYARSPLNETPFLANHGNQSKSSLHNTGSADASASDLPRRPSSVALPSIGQEGSEYAEVFSAPDELGTSPPQTRNVANDLKLHAPKPSLPQSSATARVSAVTRTDSGQAASFGIGKAGSDDKDPASRDLKAKASFASQASNSTERRPSSVESDHGIPEIGQRVPMYPNAGDVQAPSPAPIPQPYAPGIGFHNDGSRPRHHGRKTSARGNNDLPLEAYGKHGHGVLPHDRFEKAYYEKHPELIKKEIENYHERPAWAMSSDDLNKIVRDTASRSSGLGTSGVVGTPSEQIGFQAAEEYASRISSPRPQSSYNPAHSNVSDTHVDSPLRKQSFPADVSDKHEFESTLSRTLSRSLHAPSDVALSESEMEDEDTIHVDAPEHRINKIYGSAGRFESTESLGRDFNDEEYSTPILAADEVAKEPFGWDLQPAVSPMNERRGSDSGYHLRTGSASSLAGSRPTSRPGSIHGTIPGLRMTESTPLEDLEEYEPLFPEDEKNGSAKRPLTAADRLKRPELKASLLYNQDIWEDAPNSLNYTATVSTPELPVANEEDQKTEETPEQAFARRQEELAEEESQHSDSFLNREKKPWAHKSHLVEETRPGLQQRFPSRDIWEDAPDSLQLQTTVAAPQSPEKELLSPPEERPTTGAVAYHQEKAAAGLPLGSEEGRATTGIAAVSKPQIPTRPARSKHSDTPEKPQPSVPDRPSRLRQMDGPAPSIPTKTKPQVPARPSKPVARGSSENVPLTQVTSNSSTKSAGSDQGASAPAVKSKPPVPSRPVGSKIAALQGGFMSDLNKRLQLGPQAPKKEEVTPDEPEIEKEKVPLVDARKGRARGPARRAPAKSPAPVTEEPSHKPNPLSFCMTSTCWAIDPEEDFVHVPSDEQEAISAPETKAAQSEIPTLATNTAGEKLHEASEIAPEAEKSASVPSAVEDTNTEPAEEVQKEEIVTAVQEDELEPVKGTDEPPVVSQVPEGEAEDLTASTGTVKPDDVVE